MNITHLNSSLLINFMENSTIQEITDQLMVEQWNSSIMYDNYYNQCQPSQCIYTYKTKNSAIYIVTTIIGLIGGLITCLRFVVPRLVMFVRMKKELARAEMGKICQ